MKRLKKSSEYENPAVDFINNWFYTHDEVDSSTIDNIVNQNGDCVDIERGFRFIRLDNIDFYQYDIKNEEEVNQLVDEVKNKIGVINTFSSFAKSVDGVKNFISVAGGMGVIVSEVITGLDIPKLTRKVINETSEEDLIELEEAVIEEDEIINIEPINKYDIVAIVYSFKDIEWIKLV